MRKIHFQKSTLALIAILVPALVLFIFVALRSGPLAPIAVVLAQVENVALSPALFGIGTIEARYSYKIGPTISGRLKHVDVQVGEFVKEGQVLGEMDPVDLDERLDAQDASLKRVQAQLSEAQARKDFAQTQFLRYEQLFKALSTSEEVLGAKQQEHALAEAGLRAAQAELSRVRAERSALKAQRRNLVFSAPVDSLVASRHVDPGSTVLAGQTVVELIDASNLWVNVRLDQMRSQGLVAGLPAQINLRSQADKLQSGRVLRAEPLADSVTEEALAKVVFDQIPDPLPPLGELAEVTIALPTLSAAPVIPNAAIHYINGILGVWQVIEGDLHFTQISLGSADLEGRVQVKEGLKIGDQIVSYSETALKENKRIRIVDQIAGVRK